MSLCAIILIVKTVKLYDFEGNMNHQVISENNRAIIVALFEEGLP